MISEALNECIVAGFLVFFRTALRPSSLFTHVGVRFAHMEQAKRAVGLSFEPSSLLASPLI